MDANGQSTPSGMTMDGIASFMGLPYLKPTKENLAAEKVRAAFVGVPYEGGNISNIFRSGVSRGPRAVRAASTHLTPYNWELDMDIVAHYNLRDCGDVPVVHTDAAKTRDILEGFTDNLLDAGVLPVYVGGDHSIPVPIGRSLSARTSGKMGFLVLDSHLDTAEDMDGDPFTNCSLHPRFLEFGNVEPQNIAIIGHHGNSIRPTEVAWIEEHGINVYFQNDVWERGIESVVNEALDRVWDGVDTVYVSFDTDVVDAAYMPGTCSSEPGGLTSRELLKAARLIGARGFHMLDAVEHAPAWDNNEISARLVVYFIINSLAANAWHENSGLPYGTACVQSATTTPKRGAVAARQAAEASAT
jgi:agmatinase